MNSILKFVRTTVIGGVLYLVPIVILVVVIGKALEIAHRIAPAFSGLIAAVQLGHVLTPAVFAVVLVVMFCFLAGLFSRTRFAGSLVRFLDSKILINIPGYSLFRSVTGGSEHFDSMAQRPVLFSTDDGAWQIAFVVDRIAEARVAVYVPGVPEARSGSLFFVTPDRVRPLEMKAAEAFQLLRRMGVGSADLLQAAIR